MVHPHIPFLARRDAPHAMHLVQYRLQACQNRPIKFDGERAFQSRLVLRLLEQVLQSKELDLQMQLPMLFEETNKNVRQRRNTDERPPAYIAMNSSTELLSRRGSNDVSSSGSSRSSDSTASVGLSGEYELDATRRVYSQPIFRQNLRHKKSAQKKTKKNKIVRTLPAAC
jgi:hypothetical protein